jgi:hypothetical protein
VFSIDTHTGERHVPGFVRGDSSTALDQGKQLTEGRNTTKSPKIWQKLPTQLEISPHPTSIHTDSIKINNQWVKRATGNILTAQTQDIV